MGAKNNRSEHDSLSAVIDALEGLQEEARDRILKTAATFFDHGEARIGGDARLPTSSHRINSARSTTVADREPKFSDHPDLSPKQFLEEKQPLTDIERVACLAFYLSHYRDTPHFKTLDISKLNTDAAQFKFSNAAVAVNNAAAKGLLAAATKGQKQISAIGEQFVAALPDRDAAKKVLERIRSRRAKGKPRSGKRKVKKLKQPAR